MKLILIIIAVGLGIFLMIGCDPSSTSVSSAPEPEPVTNLFDQFIAQVDTTAEEERQALVDSFMQSIAVYAKPLTWDTTAIYLYQGNPSSSVQVPGDNNGWNPAVDVMANVDSTDFYYLIKTFPEDARLDYKFKIGNNWILDPLNPRTVTGGFGPNSELAMPAYVDPPEILEYPELEHGTVLQTTFDSEILGNSRTIRVYLPSGYEAGEEDYPTIYVHDGGEYYSLASMANVLDYSIANEICRPVIAVFVDPVNRNDEYWLNDLFMQAFVEEIVPYIDGQYHTLNDPSQRGVMGASLGGLTAFYFALMHPEIFGLCGSQSGALQINSGEIVALYQFNSKKDLKVYFDCGTCETLLDDNRQMRDVLESKDYDFVYREWNEGHSWGNWRAHIDEILQTLFGVD
ncbi:hypothetical protein KKA08_07315 [bacterium]|nr:hypothetical protein [bacterium]